MSEAKPCPVRAYAEAVLSGEIVAGRLVRAACRRHLHDLEHGHERGLHWDAKAAAKIIRFAKDIIKLNGGKFEGKPFVLLSWQMFVVGSLFGWKREDGFRRFRTAYIEAAKGSGKSPALALCGLYCLIADGEARAEVYAAANKLDQARILFRDAVAMVQQSPELASVCKVSGGADTQWNIAYYQTGSFFRAIGAEKKTQSGPRPSCALIDEIHEAPDGSIINMMLAGTKFRTQPLIIEATNSGTDRNSICYEHHEYSARVATGFDSLDGMKDDSWFAYVCQLDVCEEHEKDGHEVPVDGCEKCDDWRDEKVWLKTNPSLPTIPTMEYLRNQVHRAQGMPTELSTIKRLNFCVWTSAAVHAIPMDAWNVCGRTINPKDYDGKSCWAALDIGSTSDFTALARVFPHDDDEPVYLPIDPENPDMGKYRIIRRSYTVLVNFWLPEFPVVRSRSMQEVIAVWCRQGHIRTTPGNAVDYDLVLEDILRLGKLTPFTAFGVDRGFQGGSMATSLIKSFGEEKVKEFPQGIISMNAPFRELLELVKQGRIHHPKHPVLTWMCGNCAAETRGGLIKPSKDHSSEKIDGVTAMTMALGLAMSVQEETEWYTQGCLLN